MALVLFSNTFGCEFFCTFLVAHHVFDSYLKTKGYPYKSLVAFSGSVSDPEKPLPDLHTESNMNGVPESKTVETFQQNEYRFLIVARKFQTGFNQPLLQTMYVDKKLTGIEAVQTLSRLNRTTANKGDVFVLDFANETQDIQASFQDYYQATILSETTDPNKLYDLKDRLEKFYLFEKAEIETFASVYFPTRQNPNPNQAKLHPILNPIVDSYKKRSPEEKADFRSLLGAYVRTYAFLVQILTFSDADLEKFYQFARFLLKKLPIDRGRLPTELVNHISMDSYKIKKTSEDDENGKPKPILLKAEDGYLKPLSGLGTGQPITENLAPLSEVLDYINEHYGTDFVHEDKLAFFSEDVFRRLDKSEGIYRALDPKINPSQETQKLAFETYFREILEDMIDTNFDIYQKLSDDTEFGNLFRQVMFNNFQKDLSDRRDRNAG